jgi:hypothetical protein
VSRPTGEPPAVRLEVERPFLAPLPRVRFDTDYVETRRVHTAFPFVVIDGVRYSVPPRVLGQLVEIRRPVDAERFEIRWAGQPIAAHTIKRAARREEIVWDAEHRKAAEDEALNRTPRRHLHVVEPVPELVQQRLDLAGDVDVDEPDLAARYAFGALDEEPSA